MEDAGQDDGIDQKILKMPVDGIKEQTMLIENHIGVNNLLDALVREPSLNP